jgi:hypothetical protein
MPMTSTERQRAFRERARTKGFCLVCGQRKAAAGLKVCKNCNDAAKVRGRRLRGTLGPKSNADRKAKYLASIELAYRNADAYITRGGIDFISLSMAAFIEHLDEAFNEGSRQ